ncbi:AlpA family phage regulatory protein [Rhizobium calliandrae]|uniref:AlpA family phage regulatory protein n=1 Tax=Rhizobium calliandrae TaxID=1312182 RepID=A0ABT7KQT8_9HYPH|nr:AlpA family phage regulatory protein [Rhizobium calliandrae]MDL2410831.1 AlpA family phage regulatory protein [Rhizobium calliandrae]
MAKRPPRGPKSSRTISNPYGVYSYREVCELTTFSRQTIYRLRKKRLFPEGRKPTPGRIVWSKDVIHLYQAGKWKPDPPEPDDDNHDDGNDG